MADAPAPKALERLAVCVEQRIVELGLQYAEVARAAGFSDQTLIAIRNADKVRPTTYRKLEMALQWEVGSVAAVLNGGRPTAVGVPEQLEAEPVPAEPEVDPRAAAILTILEDLPPRVQAEVLRQLGDRLPPAARPEPGAKGRRREAG